MTLSGKNGRKQRVEAARAARQQREAGYSARRPWQMPVIVTIAVLVLVAVVFVSVVSGNFVG